MSEKGGAQDTGGAGGSGGAQDKGEATASPLTETTATADTKEADTESETQAEEQSSVANEAAAEPAAEEAAEKAAESAPAEKSSPAKPTADQMEVDAEQPVESTAPEPVPSSSSAADDPLASRLAEVVKTDSDPRPHADSSATASESAPKEASAPALSTENLISVLEGSVDKEPSDVAKDASETTQPPATAAPAEPQTSAAQSAPDTKAAQSVADLPPPKLNRKYIYKLKSKTGKVLKYVSSVPIVLKRPVISLTKMEDEGDDDDDEDETKAEGAAKAAHTDDADSDNSTKENNVKANDASKGVVGPRIARKRGRPPLLQKAPVITLDDSSSPDAAADAKEPFKGASSSSSSTPSYGVQTRKRQLKFLPDGRVVTPAGKKYKSAAAAAAAAVAAAASKAADNQSSDTDVLTESDDGAQQPQRKTGRLPVATKKVTPVDRRLAEKRSAAKKVFDYESYLREKLSAEAKDAKQAAAKRVADAPRATPAKTPIPPRVSAPVAAKAAPTNNAPSTPAAQKNTVDPAQLLSSLIGVPVFAHQLSVVKFKPKVIQDRKTMSAQKNVTYVDETHNRKSAAGSQPPQPRNAPFRVSAKPSLQKILPKPVSTPDRASPLIRKTTETPKTTPSAASRLAVTSSKLNAALTSPLSYGAASYRYGPAGDAPKFESFSDTKVVKTKEGPKKQQKRRVEAAADGEVRTVYDLVQNVFEQMPSWNLHIIPDTNSFCIAQVSRGRMGIPILKKSIELNGDFAAKVYVHQLHCKKYDGVYDTESKILSLIREIDALAA